MYQENPTATLIQNINLTEPANEGLVHNLVTRFHLTLPN